MAGIKADSASERALYDALQTYEGELRRLCKEMKASAESSKSCMHDKNAKDAFEVIEALADELLDALPEISTLQQTLVKRRRVLEDLENIKYR